MSTNRKRGVVGKPVKNDHADGDSVSETGNNEQKVRKVGRPRKYPVGTPATSGGNPGSTQGKGSSSSSSSSSGTNDTNKKSGTTDSTKKVPKVKKAVPNDAKKKNINKRAMELEDTSKKAIDKLQKAKTKTKLGELNKKKQLGVGKTVCKKKIVAKVKKSVGTKKNAKDAPAKLKSKSGSGGAASSSSSSSKDPKTSKAKKLAQNSETDSSSKKTKKLAAKKVKLKKLVKVKTKVVNDDKKKKKKKAVLVGGKVAAKAKKIAQGSQASIPKQKAGKKSGQAASSSGNSGDDSKKATLSLKKKPGPVKGSKRPVQKGPGENSKITKVCKSLAEKVQKIKGKTLVKVEKTKKRKEVEDSDLDGSATSSKRKKVDSVDARQPAVKKSKTAGQRSETSVRVSTKDSAAEIPDSNKSAATITLAVTAKDEKPSVSDKIPRTVGGVDTKDAEETDIPLVHKKRRLMKGLSQEEHSADSEGVNPKTADVEGGLRKLPSTGDSDFVTVPCTVDSVTPLSEANNKRVTNPSETDCEQLKTTCPVDCGRVIVPCPTSSGQVTVPCPTSSGQVTVPCPTSSEQVTAPCPTSSEQVTAPCSTSSGQVTAPCSTSSGQVTAPCPTSSGQVTAPCPTSSGQVTAPCPTSSEQVTAPCSTSSGQVTAPCPTSSGQVTAPCPTSSGHVTAPCPTSSGQVTAPCPTSSGQVMAPCPTNNKPVTITSTFDEVTAPCTADKKPVSNPHSGESKQVTAPCPVVINSSTVDSKQGMAPCKSESTQEKALIAVGEQAVCEKVDTQSNSEPATPCKVSSEQEEVNASKVCSEKANDTGEVCSELAKDLSTVCNEKPKDLSKVCNEQAKDPSKVCKEQVKDTSEVCREQENTSKIGNKLAEDSSKICGVLAKDPSNVEKKLAEDPNKVSSKQEEFHKVDSKLKEELHKVDSKLKEELHKVDSKPKEELHKVDSKPKEELHKVDSKPKEELHKVDSKPKDDLSKVDSKPVEGPNKDDCEKAKDLSKIEIKKVEDPSKVCSEQFKDPSEVDSKKTEGPSKIDSEPVSSSVNEQVAKSCTKGSEDSNQRLSVQIAAGNNTMNTSFSVTSQSANKPSSVPESVGSRLSSSMGNGKPTILSQTDRMAVGDTEPKPILNKTVDEKVVNTPKAENSKSAYSLQSDAVTKPSSDDTVVSGKRPDKFAPNVPESKPKLPLALNKSSILENSDPKIFNSLDKLKNSDAELVLQKSTNIAAVQCREKSVPNFLAAKVKSVVGDCQEKSFKKDQTESGTEDKYNKSLLTEARDKPMVSTPLTNVQSVVHERKLLTSPLVTKTLSSSSLECSSVTSIVRNKVPIENQKDNKISSDHSQEKGSVVGKDLSSTGTMPNSEASKKISPESNSESTQEKRTFSDTSSSLASSKTSSTPLCTSGKLPLSDASSSLISSKTSSTPSSTSNELPLSGTSLSLDSSKTSSIQLPKSEPTKEPHNLPKDSRGHNSIDVNFEKSRRPSDDISDSEPQHKSIELSRVADTTSFSKTGPPPKSVQKPPSDEPSCQPKALTISKPLHLPTASSAKSAVALSSTNQQVPAISCDKTIVSNPTQSIGSSKDKNIFASFSDFDSSLCEKNRSVIKMAPKTETAVEETSSIADKKILPSPTNRPSCFTLMESLTKEKGLSSTSVVTMPQGSSGTTSSSSSSSLPNVSLSTSSLKPAINALKVSHKDSSKEESLSIPPKLAPSTTTPSAFSPPLNLKNDISKTSTNFSLEKTNFIRKILVPDNLLRKQAEVSSKEDPHEPKATLMAESSSSKRTFMTQKEEDTSNQVENLEDSAKKSSVSVAPKDPCPNIFSKLDDLITSKLAGKESSSKELHSAVSKPKDTTCDLKASSDKDAVVPGKSPGSDVGSVNVARSKTPILHQTKNSAIDVPQGSVTEKVLPPSKTGTDESVKAKDSKVSSELHAEPVSCKLADDAQSDGKMKPNSITTKDDSASKTKFKSANEHLVKLSNERTSKESAEEFKNSAGDTKTGKQPLQKISDQAEKQKSEIKMETGQSKSVTDSSGKPEQSNTVAGISPTKMETNTLLPSSKCETPVRGSTALTFGPKTQNLATVETKDLPKTETEKCKSVNNATLQTAFVKGEHSPLIIKNKIKERFASKYFPQEDREIGLPKTESPPKQVAEKKLTDDIRDSVNKDAKVVDVSKEKVSTESVHDTKATVTTSKPSVTPVAAESSAKDVGVEHRPGAEKDNKSFSDKKKIESSEPLQKLSVKVSEEPKPAKLAPLPTTSGSEKVSVDAPRQDEGKPQHPKLVDKSEKFAAVANKDAASEKRAEKTPNVESEGTNAVRVVNSPQILSPGPKDRDGSRDQMAAKDTKLHKKTDSQPLKPIIASSNVGACMTKSVEMPNKTTGEKVSESNKKLSHTVPLEPPPTPYPPLYLSPKHLQDSADGTPAAQCEVLNSSSPSTIARSKVVTRPSFVVLDNSFVCVICCQMCRSKRTFQSHIWWHFHVCRKLCNHCPTVQQPSADGNTALQHQQPNKCPYVLDVMLKICRARKKMHRSIIRSDADQSNREKTFAEDETDTESVDLDYELDNGGSGGGGDSYGGKPTDQSLLTPPRGQGVAQSEKDGKTYTDLTDDSNSIFAPANVDYLRSLYSSGSKKRTKKSSSASNAQNHHHHHQHHHHHHHSSSSSSSSSTSSSMVASSASAAAQKKGSFYVCGFQYCTYSCMNCLQFRLHLQQCHNFETVFPCYHCGQTNYSKDDLIKHMYNHSNARDFLLFRCSFPRCRFGTNMLQEFHEHNNIFHVGELVFTCFYCSTEFSELSQLLAHLQANLLKFVQCPHCTVKDRNRRTVLNHISTEHPLKPKQIVVTSQVVCKKKQTVSPDQSSELSQHQQQLNLHRSLSEDRILECIKCGLLCRNIATLRKHSRVCLKDALSHKKSFATSTKDNHWTQVYSCQWCSFPASSDTMLFQHTVDQHPGKNANFEQIELKMSGSGGNTGDSRLSTSSWLEAAKSGAFICPYCKVAFHNERNWSEHMEREHNGDEHDIGGKKGLDGEMKYPCDFCEFNGTSEQDLLEHQQIMTATEGPDGMHRKVVDLANITPKVTLLTDTKLTVSNVLSFKRFKRSPSKKMNKAYFKCSGCHFRSLSKWQSLRHVKHCSLAKRRLSEYIRKRSSMDNGGTDGVKIEPVDLDIKPLEIDEEQSSASPSSDRPKTALEDDDMRNEWSTRMMSYMRDKQMNLMAKEGILDCTESEGYRCSICRHTGKTMINIRQHLWKTHLKLKPVHCPCCPFTSWKNYTLEKHKISKHHHSHPNLSDYEMKTLAQNLQGTTDGLIECQLCFYKSPSTYKVRTHIWRTHMHLEMKQCSLCAYKCWYLYLMNMHQLSRHKNEKIRAIDGNPSKQEIEDEEDDEDDDDNNGGQLEKTAADNICNFLGNSSTMSDEDMSLSAKGLMEKKSGNKIECCVCRYECTRIMIMKIHIWKRHLNINQRRCPRCPYICWLQSRLQQHVCRIGTSGPSKSSSTSNSEASTLSHKESKSRWVISKADEFGCRLYINKSKRPPKRLSMDETGQPIPKKFRSMSDGGSVINSGGGGGGGRGATTTTNYSKGSKNFSWIRHHWENSVSQSFFRVGSRKLFARTTDRVNQMEIFTCVYCSYKSWNMEAMCHHSYKHKLQCGYCLFRAYSRKKIMEHIDEFHQAPPKIIRDENYKKYRMVFPSLGASRDKLRNKMSNERQRRRRRASGSARNSNVINLDDSEESDFDSESTSDWRPSSDSEDEEEECVTRYCCCHCSMRTHDFERFRKHVAKHSRCSEELQCPTCVYRTRDAYKFQQHIRRHPSEHFCGYCNFSSMQESFVQLHVRRVHPKKPVQIHIRSKTMAAAAAANSGRTFPPPTGAAANFNARVILQDILALDTVEFETMLKTNVVHSLDLENIILEEDKLLSVL